MTGHEAVRRAMGVTPRGPRTAGPSASSLLEQQVPGQVTIAGDSAVYTLRRVVAGRERTELWSVPCSGGVAAPLVAGEGRRWCPRPSPTGRLLAFLQADGTAATQAALLELPDGTPSTLSACPAGVHDLAWCPDETALIALVEDTVSARVHRAAGLDAQATPTALRLTTIDWRSDGADPSGLRLHPRHLHRVPLDGGDSVQLTEGSWSASRPRVDGLGRIHFLADTGAEADLRPAPQVHRLEHDGAGRLRPRRLTALPGGVERYHVRGARLRVLGHVQADRPDDQPARWFELDDHEQLVGLGAEDSAAVWQGRLGDETDLHDWQLELDDDFGATTASQDSSTMPVDTASGASWGVGLGVSGAVARVGARRVAVLSLADGPWAPEVYAVTDTGRQRLTEHGTWLERHPRPAMERRDISGPGGPITVHVLHPTAGTELKGTVLSLHGGPTGQWAVVPPLEALLLAAAGYRVAMPNLRGSIDRGPTWVAPLRGAWGEVDAADALAVCDGLVDVGLAEAGHLGVMGLSYGGFLTQWLIGVTDRFTAAVSENGVTNQVSAWASCDTGPSFCRSSDLGDPLSPEGIRRLWACSPLRNVTAVHTPLLMLQGADDRTCPASDNEQFFVALRSLRRVVEYVIYPEESHLMQATGRIDRRIDRHQRVVSWFDQHLGAGDRS